MSEEGVERRLTTILTADVVGYSRLMAADEAGTLAQLKAHRKELIDPKTADYGGRVVKLMGDGTLMEFGSVVDAVRFAVDVQQAMAERNAKVPEDQRITFRVGINIGDIIVEGDDIYGDGVNIAARLEALADPGGICVARNVVDQVKSKVEVRFEDLGDQKVKNIPEPVQVFKVLLNSAADHIVTAAEPKRSIRWPVVAGVITVLAIGAGTVLWQRPWEPREEPASEANMAYPLPDRPSIAVLPFNNMSDDASQEYFADGMTEDLITDLSKISGLFVISRNSSFSYKGQQVKIRKVAEELGVRYVLEGSVRRVGDQLRINAQLIDATTGGHLWAERYDGSSADVFALQDKVTNNIVSALALTLTPREVESVAKAGTDNAAAHDAYLLGLSHYHRRTPKDNATARSHFVQAVQLDPNYAAAYSALAKVYLRGIFDWSYGEKLGVSRVEGTARPWKYLQRAKAKPNSDYFIVRSRLALKRHQPERAISEARRALDLSSNDTEAMEALAAGLIFVGQSKAGIEYAQKAMRQNPTHLGRPLYLIGLAEFSLGNTAEAVKFLNRAIKHAPDEARFFGVLAAAYGELGKSAQAKAAFEKWKPGDGTWRLDEVVAKYPISDAGVLDRFANGLKDAGVSVQSGGYYPVHTANKLTGPEIKSLLFGTQIGGDHTWCSSFCLWQQVRKPDGTVQHLGHPIQPGVAAKDTGSGKIKNDMLCEIWPKLAKDIELCVVVFRITDRIARIKWGDYIMVTDHGPMPFSLTD